MLIPLAVLDAVLRYQTALKGDELLVHGTDSLDCLHQPLVLPLALLVQFARVLLSIVPVLLHPYRRSTYARFDNMTELVNI